MEKWMLGKKSSARAANANRMAGICKVIHHLDGNKEPEGHLMVIVFVVFINSTQWRCGGGGVGRNVNSRL